MLAGNIHCNVYFAFNRVRYLFARRSEWFGRKSAKGLRMRLYEVDVIGLWKMYGLYTRKTSPFRWQRFRKSYFAEDRYTCSYVREIYRKNFSKVETPFFSETNTWLSDLDTRGNEQLIKMNASAMMGEWKSCSPCKWSTSGQSTFIYLSIFQFRFSR